MTSYISSFNSYLELDVLNWDSTPKVLLILGALESMNHLVYSVPSDEGSILMSRESFR